MAIDPVSLAITAAMTAASMALTASQQFEGPRLDTTDVTLAEYGTPLPFVWGERRLEGVPIIWAKKLREKKVTSKTKGGKFANYKYYATFAVILTGHPIDAVVEVRFDKHLVYQARVAGPVSPVLPLIRGPLGIPVKLANSNNMRIYLGDEAQMPDPAMQEWCEDRYGPDSCPAYRGRSLIVFEDVPVEKFGNRIPQVTVNVLAHAADAFPYDTRAAFGMPLAGALFSGDYTRLLTGGGGTFQFWDVPNRQLIRTINTGGGSAAVDETGMVYALDSFFGQNLIQFDESGAETIIVPAAHFPLIMGSVWVVGGRILLIPAGGGDAYQAGGDQLSALGVGFNVSGFFADLDGSAWAVGNTGATVHFHNLDTGQAFSVTSPGSAAPHAMTNAQGQFLVSQESSGVLLLVDPVTGTLVSSRTSGVPPHNPALAFRNVQIGAASIWLGGAKIDTGDLSTMPSFAFDNWVGLGSIQDSVYDPTNNALIAKPLFIDTFNWLYLDRHDNNGVQLGEIMADLATRVGAQNVSTSALDQLILGFSTSQGSARAMAEPLLALHDSEPRPHGFALEFIKRTGISGGLLDSPNFVRGGERRYSVKIAPDADLPHRIFLNFADRDHDQQTNTVIFQRPGGTSGSQRELTIDATTYVGVPDDMQKLIDRYGRRIWNERESLEFELDQSELALEPGDCRTPSLSGLAHGARCRRITKSGGVLRTEWVRDVPSLSGLGTGTGQPMEGRDPDEILVPTPTKGAVLDMPLASDAHEVTNVPQLYYGAGRYISGFWPGAAVYRADEDGDEFAEWNGIDSTQGMTWGYATDALGDTNPWLWDYANSVNVDVRGGSPSNATEDEIDADPLLNLAYLGGELLQFATATLESDGTYTFSTLKRGRRGTEWACGTHAVGDQLVLVEDLLRDGLPLSEVGTVEAYKVAVLGREPDTSPAIRFAPFSGATLKPYAPAAFLATLDVATGDWLFTATRRTRIGGAWTSGTPIPWGEAVQAFELDIPKSDGTMRTLSAATPTFTWTAAEQTADYGASQVTLPAGIALYQMSDAVGRGFAATSPAIAA